MHFSCISGMWRKKIINICKNAVTFANTWVSSATCTVKKKKSFPTVKSSRSDKVSFHGGLIHLFPDPHIVTQPSLLLKYMREYRYIPGYDPLWWRSRLILSDKNWFSHMYKWWITLDQTPCAFFSFASRLIKQLLTFRKWQLIYLQWWWSSFKVWLYLPPLT